MSDVERPGPDDGDRPVGDPSTDDTRPDDPGLDGPDLDDTGLDEGVAGAGPVDEHDEIDLDDEGEVEDEVGPDADDGIEDLDDVEDLSADEDPEVPVDEDDSAWAEDDEDAQPADEVDEDTTPVHRSAAAAAVAGAASTHTGADQDTTVQPAVEHDAEARDAGPADEDPDPPADDDGPAGLTSAAAPAEETPRRQGRLLLLAAVVVLGALYVGGYLLTGSRMPADATVGGVEVGGMSPASARAALEEGLAPREDEPVVLTHDDETFEVDPADVGLALDVDASVEQAGGTRSWDPRDMVALFLGSQEHAPVVEADDEALDTAVQAVAEAVDVPVTEALITFPDAEPKARAPEPGTVVRKADAARLVKDEYLVQTAPAEVPMADVEPAVDEAGLRRALTEIAEPAVAEPVTIEVGDREVELPVTAYAPALTVEPVDGAMAPVIDPERLAEALTDATTGIGRKAVDATVEIRDEKPVVVPSKEGVGLQPAEMAQKLVPVLTETGDARRVQVEAEVVEPAFTTEDAEALGITEKISEFTTEYPHAEYRNINQGRAAEILNGTILEPGETFSFNDTVGERTAANGFTTGSVINNGRFQDELGGGVSQVVTTTYNAAFFAGLDDVEHHPHAFYIDRYPVGREATVYFGSLDLRFRNNLQNGVLIRAFVQPSAPGGVGRTTVQMWGTKEFDVEAGQSERRNFRTPATRYDDADDCVAQAPLQGFDIDIYRTIRKDGEVVKRETDTATYQAADRIVCGEDPDED